MNIAIENHDLKQNYPDEEEIRQAVKACCGRCCVACETPVEYAWRKRETDMALLLDTAIERELTDNERRVIYARYFEDKSVSEIAKELSLAPSSVRETRLRAERKLKKALAYLYMYVTDTVTKPDFEICLDNSFSVLAAKKQTPLKVGARLRNIRVGRALTREKASDVLGIGMERLGRIERGKANPDALEIRRICGVFGVSYEKLLGRLN
ncbi:MAG: transcriptional regulator [Clostridia bacterium]|nr:transcriptional regulator [Clostridia bacterium]